MEAPRRRAGLILVLAGRACRRLTLEWGDAQGELDLAPDFETAGRQLVRAAVAASDEEPGWTPLLMEFWTHAARDEDLRRAVIERNERQLDAVTRLHEELAERHGTTFVRPVREILRAITAMSRGFGLERRIAPGDHLETVFEDYAVALMDAFTETRSTT